MSAAEFVKKHGATVRISSRNDQLNRAELARIEAKFGSSTSDAPRPDPAQVPHLAGESISSR